jgi:diguanylate cyclase (GGDEF)-like protein
VGANDDPAIAASGIHAFVQAGDCYPARVLNQFKAVNDRYGHGVGDRVLAEFARIFSESAERSICGRWGGDEFVAILPQRNDAAIRQIFDRVEARTQAWSHGNGLPMAVSLGVAQAPHDGHDLVTLLSVADIHLYQSKSQKPETAGAHPYYRNLVNEP